METVLALILWGQVSFADRPSNVTGYRWFQDSELAVLAVQESLPSPTLRRDLLAEGATEIEQPQGDEEDE